MTGPSQIAGSLVDIAVPELLQLLHLSARSGTLYFDRDDDHAYISFHQGRIASAWWGGAMTVVDYLSETGRLHAEEVARAREMHERDPSRSLGEILLKNAALSADVLRDAVGRKIEQTVLELVGWRRGTFRFEVEEVRYDEELLFVPTDVVPQIDLDTHLVLMQALRITDEKAGRESRPLPRITAPPAPAPVALPRRVDVVTRDAELFAAIEQAFGDAVPVEAAVWSAAAAALIVCDLRAGDCGPLTRLRHDHPDAAVIAVIADGTPPGDALRAGATSATTLDSLAPCCRAVLHVLGRAGGPLHPGLAKVREFVRAIRSGLASTNLSLNLMATVAQFADRGVLFAVRRDTLVALTAFGRIADGTLLADATRKMSMVFEEGGSFELCFQAGYALELEWDHDDLPDGLRMVLGRPACGQGVLFPLMGARKPIAVIYADSGSRPDRLVDIEVMELATGQFGLAIENEILRRQVERKL